MQPFFKDESVTIYHGDSREILKTIPDQIVNCCVTSPPYYGLRDYGVDNQIGLEPTPDEYIAEMVKVFREVKRVLRDDGTLWLNIGDSYAGSGKAPAGNLGKTHNERHLEHKAGGIVLFGCKPKDLIGIPWMLAFALRADGWYLRQDIIWHKPNPMPESVTDRCTKAHEYLFLLSKSQKYYYNQQAIKESAVKGDAGSTFDGPRDLHIHPTVQKGARFGGKKYGEDESIKTRTKSGNEYLFSGLRNKRSVWTVATRPYTESHFAVFPSDLIQPCIVAGCLPGGIVLDPFAGSGTTLEVSEKNGCKAIGIELSSDYCALMLKRLRQKGFQFGGL